MEEAKILAIITLLLISVYIWRLIKKFRYKTAFKFGRIEHRFARITFAFLVLGSALLILKEEEIALYVILLSGACWIIYWTSHRLEKWFHPKH